MSQTTPYRMSIQMLEFFLKKNSFSTVRAYLEITYAYSGKFHIRNLGELASTLGTSRNNTSKKLKKLVEFGLLNNHGNGWYFARGKKAFNIGQGFYHSKVVVIPEEILIDSKKLRTFAYAVIITTAKNHVSKKGQTRRDSVPLAAKYLTKFKKGFLDKHDSTWRKQRTKAKKLKLLSVTRDFKIIKSGGVEVANEVVFGRPYMPNGHRHIFRWINGVCYWLMEMPALVESHIKFSKVLHNFSPEERKIVKNGYSQRYCRD